MNIATKALVLGLVLAAAPAWAQDRNVTFQVDMSTALDSCAFDAETDSVLVRGSFNDWSNSGDYTVLTDDDGDETYSVTVAFNEGEALAYKFYAGTPNIDDNFDLGYEGGNDRTYTVTADETQELPVVEFFKDGGIADRCDAEPVATEPYQVIFQVDMTAQILTNNFDPETDVVTVAGGDKGEDPNSDQDDLPGINAWTNTADTLVASTTNPNIYVGAVEADLRVPSTQHYKFIIGQPEDETPQGWESIADRSFEVTGDEADADEDGRKEIVLPAVNYNNVTPDDFLSEAATVVVEVDLRPAYYHLADSTFLPADTQTGQGVDSIDGLFVNGPVAGEADGLAPWATWGPDDLGQIATRQLVDDGTKGDAVVGDSIYTITLEFDAGTPKLLTGKFGVNGYDNEGGFGADHQIQVEEGNQELELVYGAVLQGDGTYTDDNGPNVQNVAYSYDPYILIDNSATPPTVTVVRRGGEEDVAVAVEPTGIVPTEVVLKANYPNPFAGTTTFEYGIAKAEHVRLAVYDLAGRRIAVLVDEVQTPDTYRVSFDAAGLASGVYVTRLQAGGTVVSRKLTVVN